MENPVIIPISSYFANIFTAETAGDIITNVDGLNSNLTSQFTAFFSDPVFGSLHLHDKTHLTYHYKSLLQMIVDTRNEALEAFPDAIKSITVPVDIAEEYGANVMGCISAVKLCKDSFRALLRQDIGDDLEPDGYINTDAADLNEALLEFFIDVFKACCPEHFRDDQFIQNPVRKEGSAECLNVINRSELVDQSAI